MVHLSKMTGKLKGMVAINTDTTSNDFCQKMQKTNTVCKLCYSQKMLTGHRKNAVPSFRRNSVLLSSALLPLQDLPRFPTGHKPIRFSAHGELINDTHFLNLCAIARDNPHVQFTIWSKRKDIIRKNLKSKPKNLILVYSTPKINGVPSIPRGFDKVFTVFTAEFAKDKKVKINCKTDCLDCLKCYKPNSKHNTVINEIVKVYT